MSQYSAPYTPIACGLHDELQLRAMRGSRVSLRYLQRTDSGEEATVDTTDRVIDVRSRDGAEFIVLEEGAEIRLDHLLEVDGIPFRGDVC